MIGVIPKPNQAEVVEEFFELFKTPWELHRPGRVYDVVIATADELPEVNARLLIVYGPARKGIDAHLGIAARGWHQRALLRHRGTLLPIYGDLQTFADDSAGIPCATANGEIAGLRGSSGGSTVIRLGYDLFEEIQFLLTAGQPVEHAHIPALDVHIRMLREWILNAGIGLVEIPPAPAGHTFSICLTHDIDFVGIRRHRFDHTMWGFLYRSTAGAIPNFLKGRISLAQLLKTWRAVVSLPFVYLGWAKDFWDPFEWYLGVEENLPATYFFIPFKKRAGENVSVEHASWRAASYDVSDVPQWTATLMKEGCELGVHGIDAWHSVEKGQAELARIAAVSGKSAIGIRMHWLLWDDNTVRVLEEAGYVYDSTAGYNETVGYRSGTSQVFRPLGARTLLELPLHVQDGALFYPGRLGLTQEEAWSRCARVIDHARDSGGVLTVLWHDRSHAPERFWGDFYITLVRVLKSAGGWFGTAAQVVDWFRKRREIGFEQVQAADGAVQTCLRYRGEKISPALKIRVHRPYPETDGVEPPPKEFVDIPWNGQNSEELNRLLASVGERSGRLAAAESSTDESGFFAGKIQPASSLL